MTFSKYPDQLDDSISLPPSLDLITPVKAEVVNRLRDAILAVETELGIQPSSTFGTVKARLDNIDNLLSELGINASGAFNTVAERLDNIEAQILQLQNADKIIIPLAINASVQLNTTYTVIGGDEFNPADYPSDGRQIVFVARVNTINTSISADIRLFNVTDNASVASTEFSTLSATTVRNETILSVPTDLPNSEKTYEVQLKQGTLSTSPVFCVKAELHVILS